MNLFKNNKKTNNLKQELKSQSGNFDLIIAVINRGYADFVVEASRDAGATGATIVYGRGTCQNDEKIMGISMQAEKEMVLILVDKKSRVKVMKEIAERTSLDENGKGICFSLPVNNMAGLMNSTNELDNTLKQENEDKQPITK